MRSLPSFLLVQGCQTGVHVQATAYPSSMKGKKCHKASCDGNLTPQVWHSCSSLFCLALFYWFYCHFKKIESSGVIKSWPEHKFNKLSLLLTLLLILLYQKNLFFFNSCLSITEVCLSNFQLFIIKHTLVPLTLSPHNFHVQMCQTTGSRQSQFNHPFNSYSISVEVIKQRAMLMVIRDQP